MKNAEETRLHPCTQAGQRKMPQDYLQEWAERSLLELELGFGGTRELTDCASKVAGSYR